VVTRGRAALGGLAIAVRVLDLETLMRFAPERLSRYYIRMRFDSVLAGVRGRPPG
jgi:hypothetical protein